MKKQNPRAGKPATVADLVDVFKLVAAYYSEVPRPEVPLERVIFGTSGHRGSSFERSFNEWHVLAMTQAIVDYRSEQNTTGPLFLGKDTHALSEPASASALEVLAANGVEVRIADGDGFTPTPVISHAILTYNFGKQAGLSDGIVITPSHNPPPEGGYKYNSPDGGPAGVEATNWIAARANSYLEKKLEGVKRIPVEKALLASTTQKHKYLEAYVDDLEHVIDMKAIRESGIRLGVDPLGGAGVHYWKAIADRYGLNLTIVNETVDPSFSFMTLDWDGQIRMDPSSPFAMERLIRLKEDFDVSFSCDTDYDRHGIVTKSSGLLSPNHYLSAAIYYLFQHRKEWSPTAMVGKTLVSSQMIDRVAKKVGRKVFEVPVGFKWFVDGLIDRSLAFVGEESAGATFARFDGGVWTTDKDGMILALLAAEMTAKLGLDPGQLYQELTKEFGVSFYERFESPATPKQKLKLKNLTPEEVKSTQLAGEKIEAILTRAPGNKAPIGGLKVVAANGWFAARPSGTEDIYKIYVESFISKEHMELILKEARDLVNGVLG